MANILISREALARSNFRVVPADALWNENETFDEAYIFIYPSTDPINELNRDGNLLEITDFSKNHSEIYTSHRKFKVDEDTEIYVRP